MIPFTKIWAKKNIPKLYYPELTEDLIESEMNKSLKQFLAQFMKTPCPFTEFNTNTNYLKYLLNSAIKKKNNYISYIMRQTIYEGIKEFELFFCYVMTNKKESGYVVVKTPNTWKDAYKSVSMETIMPKNFDDAIKEFYT